MYSNLYLDTMKKLDYLLDQPSIVDALHFNDRSTLASWVREVWRLRMQSKREETAIEEAIAGADFDEQQL